MERNIDGLRPIKTPWIDSSRSGWFLRRVLMSSTAMVCPANTMACSSTAEVSIASATEGLSHQMASKRPTSNFSPTNTKRHAASGSDTPDALPATYDFGPEEKSKRMLRSLIEFANRDNKFSPSFVDLIHMAFPMVVKSSSMRRNPWELEISRLVGKIVEQQKESLKEKEMEKAAAVNDQVGKVDEANLRAREALKQKSSFSEKEQEIKDKLDRQKQTISQLEESIKRQREEKRKHNADQLLLERILKDIVDALHALDTRLMKGKPAAEHEYRLIEEHLRLFKADDSLIDAIRDGHKTTAGNFGRLALEEAYSSLEAHSASQKEQQEAAALKVKHWEKAVEGLEQEFADAKSIRDGLNKEYDELEYNRDRAEMRYQDHRLSHVEASRKLGALQQELKDQQKQRNEFERVVELPYLDLRTRVDAFSGTEAKSTEGVGGNLLSIEACGPPVTPLRLPLEIDAIPTGPPIMTDSSSIMRSLFSSRCQRSEERTTHPEMSPIKRGALYLFGKANSMFGNSRWEREDMRRENKMDSNNSECANGVPLNRVLVHPSMGVAPSSDTLVDRILRPVHSAYRRFSGASTVEQPQQKRSATSMIERSENFVHSRPVFLAAQPSCKACGGSGTACAVSSVPCTPIKPIKQLSAEGSGKAPSRENVITSAGINSLSSSSSSVSTRPSLSGSTISLVGTSIGSSVSSGALSDKTSLPTSSSVVDIESSVPNRGFDDNGSITPCTPMSTI